MILKIINSLVDRSLPPHITASITWWHNTTLKNERFFLSVIGTRFSVYSFTKKRFTALGFFDSRFMDYCFIQDTQVIQQMVKPD